MERQRLYPSDVQTFWKMRSGGYVYVDKTGYVYRMTHSGSTYVFLSRPRRFGKSLLTSTLHAYFEGRRDLFKGLAIERMEEEWDEYPVIHFDMSKGKHGEEAKLNRFLISQISDNEENYGMEGEGDDADVRLSRLIKRLYKQTGRQVVVLIDEYDAPLLDVVHEEENLPKLRYVMRNFYSPLKGCEQYLKFVFITGITKFSQLSIFSELNNIGNISMDEEYAGICGITKEELSSQMAEDIEILAQKQGKTWEETLRDLTEYYDGYHFTWPSPDVFNPFSLMTAMKKGKTGAYWFETGTPTYVIEMLRKYNVEPDEIGEDKVRESAFNVAIEGADNMMPLLYQSGYLTIKDYDKRLDRYRIDMPNKEVRLGLMESLLPNYMSKRKANKAMSLIPDLYDAMDRGDVDGAMRLLQAFLLTIPQTADTNYEGHYQQVLYIIFTLIGFYVDVEVHTAKGRVDMVMRTSGTLYLIELKLNKSAEAAMRQIDLKDYASRFSLCGLPIVKVGVNFSSEERTISEWKIEGQK